MTQVYHSNAKTNQHQRKIIQYSTSTNIELAKRFNINVKTVAKHKKRDDTKDKSSRPNTIHYSLNDIQKEVIRVIRVLTWCPLDDLVDTIKSSFEKANRSNVYRTLKKQGISTVPKDKIREAKKFKEYQPGYLHIDVTYLPKIEGQRYYLFVCIDRATRTLYYQVYTNKTADNAVDFLAQCKDFYPFYISHILTDNGLEFTDRFARGNKTPSGNHRFDKACQEEGIEHRLTAPATPQTNGMVERVNATIKDATIKAEVYKDIAELKSSLNQFLIFYNTNRRHGGLVKELKVRTPCDAMKEWLKLEPSLFNTTAHAFFITALDGMVQRGET